MIIDNLKAFIAKFTDTHQKNNDFIAEDPELEEELRGDPECEEEIETEDENDGYPNIPNEHLGGIPALNPEIDIPDVYGPCIPNDEIDEPTPCVYGPPSWYDDNGNLNSNNPNAKRFIDEIDAIKERNRLRAELRKLRQMEIQDSMVDKPTKCVYGPRP